MLCSLDGFAQVKVDTTGQLDSIMVLAKAVQPLGQPSSITRKDWQPGKLATRSEEALLYLPGVHIRQRGAGQISTLQYRGLQGARITQTWQGIPVTNPQLGTSDANELSLALLDRVSIGSPTDIGNAAAVAAAQTAGKQTSFSARYAQGKGYFLNGQWNGLRVLYQNDQHNFLHALNGGVERAIASGIETNSFGASLTKRITDKLSSSTYFLHSVRIQPVATIDVVDLSQLKTITGRQLFTWQTDSSRRIDLGVLYDKQNFKRSFSSQSKGSTLQALFAIKQQLSKRLSLTTDNRLVRTENDFYANTSVFPSTRTLLHYTSSVKDLQFETTAGVNARLNAGNVLFGNASLKKKISETESVQLSLKRIGRLPNLDDQFWIEGGDENLRPESGWGISTFSTGMIGPIKIAPLLFARRFTNYIIWLPRGPFWTPSNIPSVNNFGAGLDLSGKVSVNRHHLNFQGSLNYSELRLGNDYQIFPGLTLMADQNLPFSPKFTGNVSVDYSCNRWSFLAQGRYAGSQETAYNGLTRSDPFAVLRTSLSYEATLFSAALSCENVTNTIIPNDFGQFSPLRRFELTLNYSPN